MAELPTLTGYVRLIINLFTLFDQYRAENQPAKQGYIPEGLRSVDPDATWSRSSYHGRVYGYAVHMTCAEDASPVVISVETTSVSEVDGHKTRGYMVRTTPMTLPRTDTSLAGTMIGDMVAFSGWSRTMSPSM